MDVVSKEISNYASKKDKDVKILMSITGIDIFLLPCLYLQK
jgi:hypothetical protein